MTFVWDQDPDFPLLCISSVGFVLCDAVHSCNLVGSYGRSVGSEGLYEDLWILETVTLLDPFCYVHTL